MAPAEIAFYRTILPTKMIPAALANDVQKMESNSGIIETDPGQERKITVRDERSIDIVQNIVLKCFSDNSCTSVTYFLDEEEFSSNTIFLENSNEWFEVPNYKNGTLHTLVRHQISPDRTLGMRFK